MGSERGRGDRTLSRCGCVVMTGRAEGGQRGGAAARTLDLTLALMKWQARPCIASKKSLMVGCGWGLGLESHRYEGVVCVEHCGSRLWGQCCI